MEATLSNSNERIDDLVSRPIKVLFVLPSLLRAGAETQVVNLVNGLDPACFEKYLVTFERQMDQKDRIDTENVRFFPFLRKRRLDLSPVRGMARLIDEHQIDVVHCSLRIALFMGWLATLYCRKKPKLTVALHTTANRSVRDELFDRLLYQWIMRTCNKVLCVCRAQEEYWCRKFRFLVGRTQVIYNGVDPEYFRREDHLESGRKLRHHLNISEQSKVICHVAAFRPEKGHAVLVDAFLRLHQWIPDAYLLFVGDGTMRQNIENVVQGRGLSARVRFLGSKADVRPVFAASDLSVIASLAVETFSMAMLEAMAMGLPLVATNVGGTAEAVLDGETGLLVETGNAEQLASALGRLLVDNDRRVEMGRAAKSLVSKYFTLSGMVAESSAFLSRTALH